MKKLYLFAKRVFCLFLVISFSFVCFSKDAVAFDPKVKVMLAMAAYGTAGGALLGAASMAFKSNGRAVFQGASIGLWTGLLFGTYVVVTHSLKTHSFQNSAPYQENVYPDTPDAPYQEGDDYFGPYDGPGARIPDQLQWEIAYNHANSWNARLKTKKKDIPVFYMDLVTISF